MTAANPVSIGMKSVSKEHASRVLLIGGEPQLSRALEEALTERNCVFRYAAGSADSLRQLRQAPYDVVITDPAISVDEDLALSSELRAIRPGVRVIVLAQESTPEDIIAALRLRLPSVSPARPTHQGWARNRRGAQHCNWFCGSLSCLFLRSFAWSAATSGGTGVMGVANAVTGSPSGVYGLISATSGSAVMGVATATSGHTNGVWATNASTQGTGVSGNASATSGSANGVVGTSKGADGGIGVWGVYQATSGSGVGVRGDIESTASGTAGLFINASGQGLILSGLSGSSFKQVFSVDASGNGFYAGNLNVTGKLTKGSGSFKIDHPLDPANKYLSHSFVESPDMMNVYNGNITTDRHGVATVTLPDYFEALNADFRYQLTVIGQFAQAIVKREIENNRFTISTNKPSVKVSWQVTGIRHDAYADAYRIPTEEDKPAAEQGYYLHPDVFGEPASKSIQAASQKASATDQLAKASNP